ncbi:MAG: preprotein translocase subunit SecG [Hyphomicrobiaceae bacterium]|nr:preprotein translocase subunit SecG [Hyphomicrobiaceae bacterium]
MITILLLLHLLIAAGLVGVVLLQRSEGGGLGIGGGGGGSFMSGRGTANFLTRTTIALAAAFFITSVGLTVLARHGTARVSPLDAAGSTKSGAPAKDGGTKPAGGVLDSLEKGKQRLPSLPKSE